MTTAQFATRWLDSEGKRRNHVCMTCNHEWPVEDRYFRWPIRPKLVIPWRHRLAYRGSGGGWRGVLRYGWWDFRHAFYVKPGLWGWEWGHDDQWRRWFVRVYGWGLLRIACGPKRPQRGRDQVACPACGTIFWQRPSTREARHADH